MYQRGVSWRRHQVLDDVHTFMACRLIAESWNRRRKGQIVVDRFGDVRNGDSAVSLLGNLARRECGIVATDRHQVTTFNCLQRLDNPFKAFRLLGWIGSAGAQDRTAGPMDARNLLDVQLGIHVNLAVHQMLVAFVEANDSAAAIDGFDSSRRDHTVNTRSRATTNQNTKRLARIRSHGCPSNFLIYPAESPKPASLERDAFSNGTMQTSTVTHQRQPSSQATANLLGQTKNQLSATCSM